MQKPEDKKIISRYFTIIIFMAVLGVAILGKAMFIMVFERGYWEQVRNRSIVDSLVIEPRRGNILADDGQLLASSTPQYTLFMDFYVSDRDEERRLKAQHLRDTLIMNNLALTQKAYGVFYVGVIAKAQNIIIGGASLLFCSQIFVKVGNFVTFRL